MTDDNTNTDNTTQAADQDVADISVAEEAGDSEGETASEPMDQPVEAEDSTEEELETKQAEDVTGPVEESTSEEPEQTELDQPEDTSEELSAESAETPAEQADEELPAADDSTPPVSNEPLPGKWYVVHTYSGHENKVLENLRQKIASEHLENKIFDMLVPTQDKIEIRSGKKEQVKEKIFPGYIIVRMELDDQSWLAIRTTPGVTSFVGMGNRPTPISDAEVRSIVQFMSQGAAPTFKEVFLENDTVKIIDGPFAEFIGKVDSVDKERGKVRVLVSIFGRETPVELDFLQVQKL